MFNNSPVSATMPGELMHRPAHTLGQCGASIALTVILQSSLKVRVCASVEREGDGLYQSAWCIAGERATLKISVSYVDVCADIYSYQKPCVVCVYLALKSWHIEQF